MKATIIDGKAVARAEKEKIRTEVEQLKKQGKTPGLAVILVGDDPASKIYVSSKEKDCEECGIRGVTYRLSANSTRQQLMELIDRLNRDDEIDGILVQQPMPPQLDPEELFQAVDPDKDVDAFHPRNVGLIMTGNYRFKPCTPAGVMELLNYYGIDPEGKDCVVVGRSDIVGKPQAMLLLHKNATVTICHSKTKDLAEKTRSADILISAVGKTGLITADMVKPGAVVIDVAMNRSESGKLCGDVAFEEVAEKAAYITPVPGGVGPMTRLMLMKNTIMAAKLHIQSL